MFPFYMLWYIDRLMAHVITSPRDAIQRPLQNFTYKHIVRLHCDAIYSFGCFIFNFMKASSAVNYLYKHIDDGGVEAFVCHQTVDHCRVRRKMWRKVLHDGNSLIKVFTCLNSTSIMQLKQEYSTCLNSICVYFDYDYVYMCNGSRLHCSERISNPRSRSMF